MAGVPDPRSVFRVRSVYHRCLCRYMGSCEAAENGHVGINGFDKAIHGAGSARSARRAVSTGSADSARSAGSTREHRERPGALGVPLIL